GKSRILILYFFDDCHLLVASSCFAQPPKAHCAFLPFAFSLYADRITYENSFFNYYLLKIIFFNLSIGDTFRQQKAAPFRERLPS
ncbi:MAG: hypothetical protein WAT69_07095, partial [Trichococcus flocculiformis]